VEGDHVFKTESNELSSSEPSTSNPVFLTSKQSTKRRLLKIDWVLAFGIILLIIGSGMAWLTLRHSSKSNVDNSKTLPEFKPVVPNPPPMTDMPNTAKQSKNEVVKQSKKRERAEQIASASSPRVKTKDEKNKKDNKGSDDRQVKVTNKERPRKTNKTSGNNENIYYVTEKQTGNQVGQTHRIREIFGN
jgi:hypothetical protein